MSFVASVVVKLLDPIGFVIVLLVSLLSRQRWIIPVAALTGAVIAEALLTAMQYTRVWGQGIVAGVFASTIHALACYLVLSLFRKRPDSTNADPGAKR
jgi:glucan phosphoethanolaminetransferase (alkaline phosphatase superfamily)